MINDYLYNINRELEEEIILKKINVTWTII